MSTAYVNCNRRGYIEEKIYELPGNEDPEDVIKRILKMNPQYISENEKLLIGDYPNTYTYTKSMAERSLLKLRGDIKVCLVRPSIIIACYQEPVVGWIDTLAAGGGITFGVCAGMMHHVRASDWAICDLIPADYVCNTILVGTVKAGIDPIPKLHLFHSASSHLNPLTIG